MSFTLETRQAEILRQLIELYIASAEPVSSKVLCERGGLDVSPATIRCELAGLEKAGFIRQPHTSAGRVPTELGYQYYLQHFLTQASPVARETLSLATQIRGAPDAEGAIKTLAKNLVALSGEMVVVALDPHVSYYTGVSNLLSKPDFQDIEALHAISSLVDRFDEVLTGMFHEVTDDPEVLIGSKNPFGEGMTSILIRYTNPDKTTGLLGIVGPLRMDYSKNMRLVREAKDALDQSSNL